VTQFTRNSGRGATALSTCRGSCGALLLECRHLDRTRIASAIDWAASASG
jgi:hypothetical protein